MMTYATLYVSKFFKNFKIQEKIIIFYFSIFLRKTGLNEFIIKTKNINSKIFIVCLQICNMVLPSLGKRILPCSLTLSHLKSFIGFTLKLSENRTSFHSYHHLFTIQYFFYVLTSTQIYFLILISSINSINP